VVFFLHGTPDSRVAEDFLAAPRAARPAGAVPDRAGVGAPTRSRAADGIGETLDSLLAVAVVMVLGLLPRLPFPQETQCAAAAERRRLTSRSG
jgi:hypothetical protein